ncbi:MAG: GNAT superfamily N-acetyltransferase [Planctomycetota bacterium]|jgi:GNAT superfamily N-acetyltransferase
MRIFEAKARADRIAAYQFRYRIYVEDEGRVQHYADHQRRLVEEPLDRCGRVLVAVDRGRVVGTLRTNHLAEGPLGYYESLYGIDRLSKRDRRQVAITTKLMVDPGYRGGTCALRLSKLSYRMALESGMRWGYVDSRDHTLGYFEKLGYRVLRKDLVHPEFGLATLMRLTVDDESHLQQVGSPFLSTLLSRVAA